jgi:hypothetical protein
MMRGAFLEELETRFPWVLKPAVRANTEEWEEPSGADVISDLSNWHRELAAEADPLPGDLPYKWTVSNMLRGDEGPGHFPEDVEEAVSIPEPEIEGDRSTWR